MSKAFSSLKAFIAPFAAFLLLLPLADIIGPTAKYWVFPLQTVLCGALIIWFWPRYSLKVPKKVGFTLSIAVIMLCIWILPQEAFPSYYPPRLVGFDPTVFRDRPAIYYATIVMRFVRSRWSSRFWRKYSGADFCCVISSVRISSPCPLAHSRGSPFSW